MCLVILSMALSHCAAGEDGEGGDVLQDVLTGDVVEPIEESFSAEVQLGVDETSHVFEANVLKVCRFDKEGQLYIAGSQVSPEGTRTFNLKMGVSQDEIISEDGLLLPITGIAGGEDVLAGDAQVFYEYSVGGVTQASEFVEEGAIVLYGSDPCEGTFSATMFQADDTSLNLQNGAFILELQ